MNLILISGIKRSASTAQYNLVRLALEMAGYDVRLKGHSFDLQELNTLSDNEVILCKRHPFHKPMAKAADHIFLTDRNDEDILKSLDRMWGSGNPDRLERMRKHLKEWRKYTKENHVSGYNEIVNETYNTARAIIGILGLNVNTDDLLKEFNKIEPPQSGGIDPVTRLFPNHIS